MKILLLILLLCLEASAAVLSGTVHLAQELTPRGKGMRTLFLSLYDPRSKAPMPCAAHKVTLEKDPEGQFADFSLEASSLTLMACEKIPDVFDLRGKLDKDGSAGRDAPGDLIGLLKGVKKGTQGVKLVLNTEVP